MKVVRFRMRTEHQRIEGSTPQTGTVNVGQQRVIGRGHLEIGNHHHVGTLPAMGAQHHQGFGKGWTRIGSSIETTLQEILRLL